MNFLKWENYNFFLGSGLKSGHPNPIREIRIQSVGSTRFGLYRFLDRIFINGFGLDPDFIQSIDISQSKIPKT